MDPRDEIGWTPSQQRALLTLVALLFGYLLFRVVWDGTSIADPQPTVSAREAELVVNVDPNVADVATLAALPGVGPARAADLVAYREAFSRSNPGQPAFARAEDLLKVRGFGYAMMTQLSPHLRFTSQSATAPAPPSR